LSDEVSGVVVCLEQGADCLHIVSAFFVKEYFPVLSSGGNQCKNWHAAIWHFG